MNNYAKNPFEKLFISSKTLFIGGILGIAAMLLSVLASAPSAAQLGVATLGSATQDSLSNFLFAILAIGLLGSFRSGETNCQKALFGALLFYSATSILTLAVAMKDNAPKPLLAIYFVMAIIYYFIFINHIILQTDHTGDRVTASINQVDLILVCLCSIASLVFLASQKSAALKDWCYNIGILGITVMIVCMETKIQVYKELRAEGRKNGTWTDEAKAEAKKIFKA